MIPRESTSTERPILSSYWKFHGSDWMLPSKMMPTTSPLVLTTGLPELPPMMSAVQIVFSGVLRSIFDLLFIQLCGSLYGSLLPCFAACSNAPPIVVKYGTLEPDAATCPRPSSTNPLIGP